MLCDTIFTRRSVRKYDKTPLEESVLEVYQNIWAVLKAPDS